MAQHEFAFYAGKAKDRRVYIVKNGQVVWTYDDPAGRGEISDAVLLSANGRIVIAHQFAVKVIAPDKRVVWNLEAQGNGNPHCPADLAPSTSSMSKTALRPSSRWLTS